MSVYRSFPDYVDILTLRDLTAGRCYALHPDLEFWRHVDSVSSRLQNAFTRETPTIDIRMKSKTDHVYIDIVPRKKETH